MGSTSSPCLTLLLVLGKIELTKFRVNQVKCYQFIQNQVKSAFIVKEFLFHQTCMLSDEWETWEKSC